MRDTIPCVGKRKGRMALVNRGGPIVLSPGKLRSSLVFVAAASIGLLPALAQEPGQATTPPALAESLKAKAKRLEITHVLKIDVYVDWPLVTWQVVFDADAASALIDKQATSPPPGLATRWYGWYRNLSEKLLKITLEESQRARKKLNLETDVSVEFCRDLTSPIQTCRFRGNRCTYLENVPPGLDLTAPSAANENPSDVRVTVTIRPDKTIWSAREAIRGTVTWENSGAQRVAMRPIAMPRVEVRRENGTTPPRLPAKMFICFTPVASLPTVVLIPGQRHETGFYIETDPLDLGGAVLLDDGRYELYVDDMKDYLNIPTECKPVRIQVRTSPDQDLSPRIIHFGVGGSHLVVVRENGDFEAYEVDSGRRVANGHVEDYVPMPSWKGEFLVSPDGRWLALLRRPYGGPPASGVELFRLDGNDVQARVLPLPPDFDANDQPWLRRFSPDGKLLFLAAGYSVWALTASTGEVAWKMKSAERPQLTLDGRQRVYLTDKDIQLLPRESHGASTTIPLKDAGRKELALIGHRGVYLTDRETMSASYYSSDGQQRVTFGEHVERVLAEAPDAAVVAIREREEGTYFDTSPIAFWRLDPPRLLWRLADKQPRQIAFTGPPIRVVCAIGNDGFLGNTYSSTFEVYEPGSGTLLRTLDIRYRKP